MGSDTKNAKNIMVLPGISWVEAQTAAMEVDSGFEVLNIPESARSSLEGHDFAVQPLGHPIGYGVLAVAQDILQSFTDHGADPFDWLQLAPIHPFFP
jgi:hypothetical protein